MMTYNIAQRRIVKIWQPNSRLVEICLLVGKGYRVERIGSVTLRMFLECQLPLLL